MASPVAGNQSLGKRGYEEDCDNKAVVLKKGRKRTQLVFENHSPLYVVLTAAMENDEIKCAGVFRYQGAAVRALVKTVSSLISPFAFAHHAEPQLLAPHRAQWDQFLHSDGEAVDEYNAWRTVDEDVKLHAESTVMKYYVDKIHPTLDRLSASEAACKIRDDIQDTFIGNGDFLASMALDLSAHQADSYSQTHAFVLCSMPGKHDLKTGVKCLGVFGKEFDIVQAWVAECAKSGFLSVPFRSAPPEESDLVSIVMEAYEAEIKARKKNFNPQASLNLCVRKISRQFLDVYDDSQMSLSYHKIKCEWDYTDYAMLV
jgi:hypothetical protein